MKTNTIRWIVVIGLPAALIIWFMLNPATNPTDHLINGIVLACAVVFLFKSVLFAIIAAHLRHDAAAKRQAMWQLLPFVAWIAYLVYYFVA